jgi:4-diphosphocytidyl-2-C-methyl-D-erythritol kinase|tara:strand:- start:1830 stop:2627 length:798 start_codon:yes stop_codon:yes gene_type:complete
MFSTAKINLGLFILEKRNDGYHSIASLKYPIPLTDVIEILPADTFSLQIIGKEIAGNIEDNLIWKAYNLIRSNHAISPVRIILQKTIPMGAGLGGGSSNASFVLKGLNDFFDLNLDENLLREYAGHLGSDCPFFIANSPQIATGKGEVLEPFDLSLKGKYLYLIDPQIHIGTAEAYSGVKPKDRNFNWEELKNMNFEFWRKDLKNDFEDSIFPRHPELAELKQLLYKKGAVYASMSGSGSSIFGIFDSKPEIFSSKIGTHRLFDL